MDGTLRMGGSNLDVASIRGGAVIREGDGQVIAEVRIGDSSKPLTPSMWGVWTLKFRQCDDLQLRLMCFGWLALAWNLQRSKDKAE